MRKALFAILFLLPMASLNAWATDLPSNIPDDLRLDVDSVPGGKESLICLALNDYWEARGEDVLGRVAVAKVVLNRVRDGRYPEDVCSVVTENKVPQIAKACQFSWHCDGRADTPEEQKAWRHSLLLALAILHADQNIYDPTGGALWYHATSVKPAWINELELSAEIGEHLFYRDPGAPRIHLAAAQMAERQLGGAHLIPPLHPVPPPRKPILQVAATVAADEVVHVAPMPPLAIDGVLVAADFDRWSATRKGMPEQIAVAR